jgi:hypothetical protein
MATDPKASFPVPRPVPLRGIRIALTLALLSAGAFEFFEFLTNKSWHEHHPGPGAGDVPDPLWLSILWVALPLVPWLLSFFLLSTRGLASVVAGAGVAGGFFALMFVAGLAGCVGLAVVFGPTEYFLQREISLLAVVASSLWITVSAVWIGKEHWTAFLLAAGATVIWAVCGFQFSQSAEYEWDRESQQRKAEASSHVFDAVVDAGHDITSLAGCLILNDSMHPRAGYPPSLDTLPKDWFCETKFATNAVQGYTVRYIPVTDPASGQVTNFHLTAIPLQIVPGHYALMVDSRGIVFSDPMWGISKPYVRAATSEERFSEIGQLGSNIEQYMRDNGLAAAPARLNAQAIGTTYSLEIPTIEANGTRLEIKNYVLYYLPAKVGDRSRFALSVQCQSYGRECLRSYFLDYGGVIHATGEPRQATADDPAALECEASDSQCTGVGWSVPANYR